MANLTVKVNGLQQLSKAMNDLGRKTKNRIAVKAMRQGGVIIRDQARSNAPVLKENVPHRKRGTLRKAVVTSTKVNKSGVIRTKIYVRTLKGSKIEAFKVRTGRSGAKNPNDPFYWRFVEFGTSNMVAKPFMRPAFQQSKERATNEILTTLKSEIIRESQR